MFDELLSRITDLSGFFASLQEYISGFSFNSFIMLLMMVFMIVGGVDKIRGNKHGYGEAFDNGFHAMGPLAISMVGVIAARALCCA